jgi:hypothetical protein
MASLEGWRSRYAVATIITGQGQFNSAIFVSLRGSGTPWAPIERTRPWSLKILERRVSPGPPVWVVGPNRAGRPQLIPSGESISGDGTYELEPWPSRLVSRLAAQLSKSLILSTYRPSPRSSRFMRSPDRTRQSGLTKHSSGLVELPDNGPSLPFLVNTLRPAE